MRISFIECYEWLETYSSEGKRYTYDTLTVVARVSCKGKPPVFIIPYGVGYECDDGHRCERITEKQFNHEYSRKRVDWIR